MTEPSANTATSITDCDLLAANPPDPDRIVRGVPREEMDLPLAIKACRAAVAEAPDVARFSYQLGRCLFYAGQIEEGMVSFKQAADLGYRQAHFIIGLISYRQSGGVTQDMKRIEYHWRQAARMDHFNAQVSYVTLATRGAFDGLPDVASKDEQIVFAEKAKPHLPFPGDLLIENILMALK